MATLLANVILSEVGPFAHAGDWERVCYRTCDFCEGSACDDIWAGELDEAKWRRFYELLGEAGCVVCENCQPGLLAGDHEPVEAA